MPIYEYQCQKCSGNFEQLIMKADEKAACPDCGSKKVSRLMSNFRRSSGADSIGDFGGSGRSACATCSGGNCVTCH